MAIATQVSLVTSNNQTLIVPAFKVTISVRNVKKGISTTSGFFSMQIKLFFLLVSHWCMPNKFWMDKRKMTTISGLCLLVLVIMVIGYEDSRKVKIQPNKAVNCKRKTLLRYQKIPVRDNKPMNLHVAKPLADKSLLLLYSNIQHRLITSSSALPLCSIPFYLAMMWEWGYISYVGIFQLLSACCICYLGYTTYCT